MAYLALVLDLKRIRSFLTWMVILFCPFEAFCDEYVLVMSKDNHLCREMLRKYNLDLSTNGRVMWDRHEEDSSIKWKRLDYRGNRSKWGRELLGEILATQFDINNDNVIETVVKTEYDIESNAQRDRIIIYHSDKYNYFKGKVVEVGQVLSGEIGGFFWSSKYYLKEISPGETQRKPDGVQEPYYYYLTSFRMHPFKFMGKYYVSIYNATPKAIDIKQWIVIVEYKKDNTVADLCYYLLVPDCYKK